MLTIILCILLLAIFIVGDFIHCRKCSNANEISYTPLLSTVGIFLAILGFLVPTAINDPEFHSTVTSDEYKLQPFVVDGETKYVEINGDTVHMRKDGKFFSWSLSMVKFTKPEDGKEPYAVKTHDIHKSPIDGMWIPTYDDRVRNQVLTIYVNLDSNPKSE